MEKRDIYGKDIPKKKTYVKRKYKQKREKK